jgi:predicted metalloprotease
MKWDELRRSDNVEDRRGISGRTLAVGGGGIGVVIVALIVMFLGGDPSQLLQSPGGQQTNSAPDQTQFSPQEQKLKDFVSAILGSTEDVWGQMFRQNGGTYRPPKLVLFTGRVESACGFASAASGPFYCPADQKVYIDLAFYQELKERFQAPGDFAQAYVIAHEIGHHVQNLLGTSDKVQQARSSENEAQANQLSVRLELQADFYAGVWANHARKQFPDLLEAGDLEEALNAASAIGDDKIQMQSRGYVVPDAFTHGTAAQRVRWFRKGFESGDMRQGDTFSVREP